MQAAWPALHGRHRLLQAVQGESLETTTSTNTLLTSRSSPGLSQSEKVSASKQVVAQLADGTFLQGAAARTAAGLPAAAATTTKPAALPAGVSLFIQSTSSNRKLKSGDQFLLPGGSSSSSSSSSGGLSAIAPPGANATIITTSNSGTNYTLLQLDSATTASQVVRGAGCFYKLAKVCPSHASSRAPCWC